VRLLVLFTRNFLTCFVHLYNDYCFATSVVVVNATAMLNAKRGCNLSGRPVETVGLATVLFTHLIRPYKMSVWWRILLFEVHMRGHISPLNICRGASPILNLSEDVLLVGGAFVSAEWYGAVRQSD
jgi:hypothetical protein